MKYDLAGKTVLLTGASSGIGKELALALAARGATLVLAARRREALLALAEEAKARGAKDAVVVVADLSKRGAGATLAEEAVAVAGPIDVLVNNAGVGMAGSQWVVGDHDAGREVFETNYWSPLALIAALVPSMRDRNSGVVVNVASAAIAIPFVLTGHYASSKAALALATETLRLELKGTNVQALLVLPGPVETAMLAEARQLPGIDGALALAAPGRADVLAKKIVRGIEAGRREVTYPSIVGLMRTFPGVARSAAGFAMRKMDGSDPRMVRSGEAAPALPAKAN